MLEKIIQEKNKKRAQLEKSGYNLYPASVKNTYSINQVLENFNSFSKSRKKFFIVGRVIALRNQGKIIFVDLRGEKEKIQIVISKNFIKDFKLISNNLDIGDFLEIGGMAFKTKKGEKSVEAKNLRIITKNLRPLPTHWYGLEDIESRLRQRYLDIILRPELKEMFVKKSEFWQAFREFLRSTDFLEVETPVLETTPGGADAEPFVTHHKALDIDLYLRISPELSLKKLLVGGFEKIFEIGRIFRNEGIDSEHLQDYTQLELYWAYQDYNGLMKFIEKMYKTVIKKIFGGLTAEWQKQKIYWGKKWPKIDFYQIFKKQINLDLTKASKDQLFQECLKRKLKPELHLGRGRLIDLLYKKVIRPTLIQPAFLINPPVDIEPLAKRSAQQPNQVERFQIIACGTELGKGFSEANDPIDQRIRFEEQMKLRESGDKEAQRLDESFLEALEYGMPPAAGFGFSERLFAILVDKPIREIVFFPLMKPKGR